VRGKAKEIALLIAIVLFAGLIRIPSLTQPLGPDQGIMSVIGEGILHGGLPYRDYWEMGSPAIFFTYALMFKIFGVSMAAIPVTDTFVSMLTTLLIFLLAKIIWDKRAGYISALLFAFFSNGVRLGMHAGGDIAFGTFWYIAQRETFMLPLIVASMYLLLKSDEKHGFSWSLLFTGFCSGLAFVYKFPSALIFICIIGYLNITVLTAGVNRPLKILLLKDLTLIAGFILAFVPFILVFSLGGAMNEMIDVIFRYVFSVYGHLEQNYLGIAKTALTRTLFLAQENFILWIFFITSSLYIIKNERTKENSLIVFWALASLLYVISHREFFGYHYLLVLPPFSLLTGYGINQVFDSKFSLRNIFTNEFEKVFIILAIVINLGFFATLNYMHYTKFFYLITNTITQKQYYSFFNAYPKHDYSFCADYEVSQYILENTTSSDKIYTLGGIESVVYFLTKRQSPSRFIFSWILFAPRHGEVAAAVAYRNELLTDLKQQRPKYILIVRSLDYFRSFEDLYGFVGSNYVLEKEFPDDRFLYVYNEYVKKRT
jgi:hypothetical protein